MVYRAVAGLVIDLLIVGVYWFTVARHKTSIVVPDQVQETLPIEEDKPEILTDPTIEDLGKYSKQKGGTSLVPFWLTLKKEGLKPLCYAKLRKDLRPVIIIVDGQVLPQPIAWDKRKEEIAGFLKRNNLKLAVAS